MQAVARAVEQLRSIVDKFDAFAAATELAASAPLDDVLKAWAGLGYYARARNLHACAVEIATKHCGRFPETSAGLRTLPGIGAYTAAGKNRVYAELLTAAAADLAGLFIRMFSCESV